MKRSYWLIMLLILGIASCGKQPLEPEQSAVDKQISTPVAKVADTIITEQQLEFQVNKIVGDQAAFFGGAELREKVLDSMISSRAMSVQMEKELSTEELQYLELQLNAYREELLVNQYVKKYAEPQPVSVDMVKQYYNDHKEEFSGITKRTFEYVTTTGSLSEQQRDQTIAALSTLDPNSNWQQTVKELAANGLPVQHKNVTANIAILDQPLKNLVTKTQPGNASAIQIGKAVLRVKVISEKQLPAKPLAQVSSDIRKKLAPIMMKESLKQLSEKAKKDLSVSKL